MPQSLPLQPGRRGMGLPDMSMLVDMVRQDASNRQVPFDPSQPFDMARNPQNAIPSIPTGELISGMDTARQGENMEVMRALRGIIESRTSDDAARGPGPRAPEARGKTSAERQSGLGPFQILSQALFGANTAGR